MVIGGNRVIMIILRLTWFLRCSRHLHYCGRRARRSLMIQKHHLERAPTMTIQQASSSPLAWARCA